MKSFCLILAAAVASAQHPLDPLTFDETWTALEVLREAKHLNEETRFPILTLKEPPKAGVWGWEPGQAQNWPRQASAVIRQGKDAFEAVIDLRARKLISWTPLHGAYPNIMVDEEGGDAGKEIKKHPEVIAAFKRRGIDDLTFIDCIGIPPGYFGTEEQRGRACSTSGASTRGGSGRYGRRRFQG